MRNVWKPLKSYIKRFGFHWQWCSVLSCVHRSCMTTSYDQQALLIHTLVRPSGRCFQVVSTISCHDATRRRWYPPVDRISYSAACAAHFPLIYSVRFVKSQPAASGGRRRSSSTSPLSAVRHVACYGSSVRLSVRLSITLVIRVKMDIHITILLPRPLAPSLSSHLIDFQ